MKDHANHVKKCDILQYDSFYCVTSNRLSFLILCWLWTLPHRSKYVCTFIAYSRVTWLAWHIEQEPFDIFPLRKHLMHTVGQAHILPSQNQFDKRFIQHSSVALSRVVSQHCHASHAQRESQNCAFINTSLSKAVIGRSTNLSTFDI